MKRQDQEGKKYKKKVSWLKYHWELVLDWFKRQKIFEQIRFFIREEIRSLLD